VSGYLRWYGRAGAYLLLSDEFPPFTFAVAAYPVRVAVSPGRLSRLTTALRVILAIPAAVVSLLLGPRRHHRDARRVADRARRREAAAALDKAAATLNGQAAALSRRAERDDRPRSR
jgi:hypothetical protein